MTELELFAELIRTSRHQRKMTLKALSLATGIPISTLHRIETGKGAPTYFVGLKLMMFFGASSNSLPKNSA